jgi:hypothetical protein
MQNQKVTRYPDLSNILLLNDKVQYLAIANILGEIVDIYHNSRWQNKNALSREELSENLHKIALSTSMLTFENIRLMVLDMNASKAMVINLAEDTIIIGMDKDALLPDLAHVFNYISEKIKSS